MLPGRLTVEHIKAAESRGENFIKYRRQVYALEELYVFAGIRRVESELEESGQLDESGDSKSIRKRSRKYNQPYQDEAGSPVGETSGEEDDSGASE